MSGESDKHYPEQPDELNIAVLNLLHNYDLRMAGLDDGLPFEFWVAQLRRIVS